MCPSVGPDPLINQLIRLILHSVSVVLHPPSRSPLTHSHTPSLDRLWTVFGPSIPGPQPQALGLVRCHNHNGPDGTLFVVLHVYLRATIQYCTRTQYKYNTRDCLVVRGRRTVRHQPWNRGAQCRSAREVHAYNTRHQRLASARRKDLTISIEHTPLILKALGSACCEPNTWPLQFLLSGQAERVAS